MFFVFPGFTECPNFFWNGLYRKKEKCHHQFLNCAKEPQSLADSYNIDVLSGDKVGWVCLRASDGAAREEQIWRAAVVVTDSSQRQIR